jgi:hypothetical protein
MTGKTFSQCWGVSGGAELETQARRWGVYRSISQRLTMKIYATPKPIVAKISNLIK